MRRWANLRYPLILRNGARLWGYYNREVSKYDFLSREMEAVNNALSELETAQSVRESSLPAEWIAALESAAPVYRERWWAEHNRANLAWTADAQALVKKLLDVLTKELAAAMASHGPRSRCGRMRACTPIGPAATQLSSRLTSRSP